MDKTTLSRLRDTLKTRRRDVQEAAVADDAPAVAIGEGPIEQALQLVVSGQLPLAEARRRVAAPDVAGALTPAYVAALVDVLDDSTREAAAQTPLLLGDLLVAATEAAQRASGDRGPAVEMANRAVVAYVELARSYLIDVPDGRVYRPALKLGRDLEARARAAGDSALLATILHRLGTLNLDPFIARAGSETVAEGQRLWYAQLEAALGEAIRGIDPEELAMPEPLEALRLAEGLLREAADLRSGDARARSRKAQGEAMLWRGYYGDDVDDDATAAVLKQALEDLAWDADPQHRLAVLNGLRVLGRPVTAEVDRIFERSLDDWAFRLGPALARDLVMQAYPLLRDERPRDALRLLADARPLSESLGEAALNAHLRAEITVLSELDDEEAPAPARGELIATAKALQERANAERWDVERLFARLARLAGASGVHNEEDAGLWVLQRTRASLASLLAARHAPALDWFAATLLLATGVNRFDRRDWKGGIEAYAQALAAFLALGMPSAVQDCLERIVDLTERPAENADQAVAAVEGIAPIALRAERAAGHPASTLIRRAAENVLGDTRGGVDAEQDLFAMQMAKGLRFSTALYGGSRYQWDVDARGRELLASIAEAEEQLGDETSAWAPIDEDLLVSDYVEGERFGPDDAPPQQPRERLSWLSQRYDVHVWDALLEGAEASDALWLGLEDVQAALDERTALVSFFLGTRAPDGSTAGKALVVTRTRVRSHPLPDAAPELGDVPADRIATTRRLVQDSPGPRDVSPGGAEALTADARAYLADGAILEGLRDEGVDHLCVVPHGPLHYHPLHLAGQPGRPLADDWLVTYLPNLHLFVSRRGRPAARRHRANALTSIGLGFEEANAHGLTPLRGAVAEAEAVAAAFGTAAVPEAEATEAVVARALEGSRFVHLATHGRHDAAAPAFQCIYVTPDAETDGRLQAHEVLALELRGLDLVTLSACETALGRFDSSDNLRGLPAALLLAGASTLIGTLWEVEDAASRRFFTSLYERMRAGEPCLDAFRGAQLDTRADHREYRDWGAFYLAGDWVW